MVNRVSLDNVTAENFEQLISLLSEWVPERRVRVRFWMPLTVVLKYDEDEITGLLNSSNLPSRDCILQLRYDVPVMLSAILTGQRNSAIEFLTSVTDLTEPNADQENSEELTRAEIVERMKELEERLVTEEIRHRFAVKFTTKNDIFSGAEWEVVKRQADSDSGSPANLTYATVRITAQKPVNNLRGPVDRSAFDSDSISLIMTMDDIIELRDCLDRVSTALDRSIRNGDDD